MVIRLRPEVLVVLDPPGHPDTEVGGEPVQPVGVFSAAMTPAPASAAASRGEASPGWPMGTAATVRTPESVVYISRPR
jgi:hypothetical protein